MRAGQYKKNTEMYNKQNEDAVSDTAAARYPTLHEAFGNAEKWTVEATETDNGTAYIMMGEPFQDPVRGDKKIRGPRLGNRAGVKNAPRRLLPCNRENAARIDPLNAGDFLLLRPEKNTPARLDKLRNEAQKAVRAVLALPGDNRGFLVDRIKHPVTGGNVVRVLRLNMRGKSKKKGKRGGGGAQAWESPAPAPVPTPGPSLIKKTPERFVNETTGEETQDKHLANDWALRGDHVEDTLINQPVAGFKFVCKSGLMTNDAEEAAYANKCWQIDQDSRKAAQQQLPLGDVPQKVIPTGDSKPGRNLNTIFNKITKTLQNITKPSQEDNQDNPPRDAIGGQSVNPANN